MCTIEIQDGIVGEGEIRYKYLDKKRTSLCKDCYEIRQKFNHEKDELLDIDPYIDSTFFVPENDLDVFYRFPVSDSQRLYCLNTCLYIYRYRPCFGVKIKEKFEWVTYEEVRKKFIEFAYGLSEMFEKGDFIGICSKNRIEWIYSDFACVFNQFTSVGLHPDWKEQDLVHIINQTEMKGILCEISVYDKILKLKEHCNTLKYIILLDHHDKIINLIIY